jgi:peptidoglycan/LPS O-acetylase OafA/YrhL
MFSTHAPTLAATDAPRVPAFRADAHAAYRPDIDGIRAFAVLAVIAYHINKFLLPAGFVGVDVFFVISGYLISAHIFASAARQQFSYLDFYFRRIRRIAPAMLLVLTVTLLLSQLLFLPEDAKGAAKSAVWSLGSLANVYFWLYQDAGYFAASSHTLPLLHLWSLGVEEQFYLIWPVIAMAVLRLRQRLQLWVMAAIIVLSTLYAQLAFVDTPSFVYFMLPSRCAELMVGAMLALAVVSGKTASVPARLALPLALLGALLVLGSAVFISEHAVFPGLLALPPTIGTALIILAGGVGSNGVSRLLAWAPLRWIGILSYPAYLWHWPLLAFYRYAYGEPGVAAGVALFALTMLLAWLTWRYLEQPAKRINFARWKSCYLAFGAASLALAVLASGFYLSERLFPALRDSAYARELAARRALNLPKAQSDVICLRKQLSAADLNDPHCVHGAGSASPSAVLMMGDSNAAHYVGTVSVFAEQAPFRFRNLEVGSCPPLIGDVSRFVPPRRLLACQASQAIWSQAISDAQVLILGGTWSSYQKSSPDFMPMFQAQVRQYAAMGKTVVILGKVPIIDAYDGLCREKAIRYPFMQCQAPANPMQEHIASSNMQLRQFAATLPNVHYYDAEPVICPAGQCSAYGADGASRYFDAQHLSAQGSLAVGRQVLAQGGVPSAFVAASRTALAR